ncbi:MAG: discoidin domain-containing protein, partial [Lentisphaeria bacterium]|nr:discoidin domain-containing protein [Lentisphaeria bacterium]
MKRRWLPIVMLAGALGLAGAEFRSAWSQSVTRTWIGPEYWANRLQDWRLAEGRLECLTAAENRTVGLLPWQVGAAPGPFETSARLGILSAGTSGYAGFRVGGHGRLFGIEGLEDYRDDVLKSKGLDCGVTADGRLFIGPAPRSKPMAFGVPRQGWKVLHADSTQGGEMKPESALDGDLNTFWHSTYGAPPYPHEFQVDMGAEVDVCGIVYVPRQDQVIGRINRYEVYVTPDPGAWGDPVHEGTFPNDPAPRTVRFPAKRGRYLRLRGLTDHAGRPAAAIADLFALDPATAERPALAAEDTVIVPPRDILLRLRGAVDGEACRLELQAVDAAAGTLIATRTRTVPWTQVHGALALVCDFQPRGRGDAGAADSAIAWFRDWSVAGTCLTGGTHQTFGPVLWSQYTLHRGVLKLTAQMPPLGNRDTPDVRLESGGPGRWREIARSPIDPLARTARFRIESWDTTRDVPYRVVYALVTAQGPRDFAWEGTIRRDPVDKDPLVVAAFTGNADYAFPNVDVVKHVALHDPDLLFFSGDNIYEQVGGFGVERSPLDRACLDYLRKWYCYGWAYRELLRDRPCVSIPDDHDVYQGNLWGHGGRATDRDTKGGYLMPVAWVNMVQRTQCSHLPDPYDPTPAEQGMTVYYCPLTYGRISFAILEDRKFKTGPDGLAPPTDTGRPDHVKEETF